ncbi:hypothetical protein KM043_002015 [Ampulex compressa]|nr:hypothetical protein KM043_002015 [Ampulex compressa]
MRKLELAEWEYTVCGVYVSIWIHQVLQGYQDHHGNPKPNAHLFGLFNRICKLLYYKIKPVFVFDGGVPILKKNTIASRRKQKSIATSKAQKMKVDLINNLIKHSAVKAVLNKDTKNDKDEPTEISTNLHSKTTAHDIFQLPDMPSTSKTEIYSSDDEYDSNSSVQISPRKQRKWMGNIHSVDVSSTEFRSLPADVRYDILTDLKETRKQSSWGRLHEMPEESQDFSGFQMRRLLKRRLVQESLESAEKEMGGKTLTLDELDKLLTEQGITRKGHDAAYRIAADSTTRLFYISDKDMAAINASKQRNCQEGQFPNKDDEHSEPVAGPSNVVPISEDMNAYELDDSWDSDVELVSTNTMSTVENINEYEFESDFESEEDMNESRPLSKKYFGRNYMNPALMYMLENSDLTQKQVINLLEENRTALKTSEQNVKFWEENKSPNLAECTSEEVIDHKKFPITSKEDEKSDEIDLIESGPKCELLVTNKLSCTSTDLKDFNDSTSPKTYDDVSTSFKKVISEPSSPKSDSAINTTVVSVSSSDSDDFVEIQDVPIPNVDIVNTYSTQESIQIKIKSDEKMEDDMFADIFESKKENTSSKTQHENVIPEICFTSEKTENRDLEVNEADDKLLKPMNNEAYEKLDKSEESSSKVSLDNVEVIGSNIGKNNTQDSAYVEDVTDQNVANEDASKSESAKSIPLPSNEEELVSLKEQLEVQQKELTGTIGKFERQATNVTDQIRMEAQELLQLFGIPYIVAPMEAEAQCGYLEQIHLTDGTITDDSDIWLFGGQCVYKNFFFNNKRVLQFQSADIQHHLKLTRNQMIQLALLVGSDYTTGINGIGPVTGLEILAAFPTEGDNLLQGLTNFCTWVKAGRIASSGKTRLRNKLKNISIEKGFPSQAVVQAYLFPTINESKEGFTWGKPNVVLLSDYARQKFGWTKEKFEKIIGPVLKRVEEGKKQRPIDSYYKLKVVPKPIETNLSKRVQKAIQSMNSEESEMSENNKDTVQENEDKAPAKIKKPKEKKGQKDASISVDLSSTIEIDKSVLDKPKFVEEYIPQKEKDKAEALKRRLRAIEVYRKSKQGLHKTRKVKRYVRKVKEQAELSESDSNSN